MPTLSPPLPIVNPSSPDETGEYRSWAHVSGWAQLSGTRRTVSCVLACQDQARILVDLLPALTDTLTECGYPWEMIAVDCNSTDQTRQVLALWSDVPGFRFLRCAAGAPKALALATGLCDSRGDAVVLVDAGLPRIPEHVPSMILHWEAGARLVCWVEEGAGRAAQLMHWDEAKLQGLATRDGIALPAEATRFSLLDRSLVNELVGRA